MSSENVIQFPNSVHESVQAAAQKVAQDEAKSFVGEATHPENTAPAGIVISNGEAKPLTEIPAEIQAAMAAEASQPTEEAPPEPAFQLDEENPLNEISEKQLRMLMTQMRDMMGMLESQWNSTQQEFKLTDTHMKLLYGYNEEHAQPMPEGLSEEEAAKWDPFNGLDSLTEEKALEIFGEGHPIIGLEHTITMDRVKSVIQDFFSWMTAVREYRQIHDSYMELIELSEEKEIESLKEYRDKVEDPEKKEQIQKAVDLYYNRKYMDFLAEPLSDKQIGILVKAYSDEKKIGYWIERARVKLNQLKISPKVILEVAQFEKRFLPEEYHGQVNILLLHFINMVVYSDVYNKADSQRNKVVCMVFGLDKIIRNVWPAETRERIINNIITFEKQFVGKLPKPEEENVQQ